jgi:PTH1 family peptidyl-tRNA hydrolase
VRIGIGHPGDRRIVVHYVLQDFSKSERTWLGPLLEATALNAPLLVEAKDSEFMNALPGAMAVWLMEISAFT